MKARGPTPIALAALAWLACRGGAAGPAVELYSDPAVVDLGEVALTGEQPEIVVSVANIGAEEAEVQTVALTGDGAEFLVFDELDLPLTLAPGDVLHVVLRVEGILPDTELGAYEAELLVAASGEVYAEKGCNKAAEPVSDELEIPILFSVLQDCDNDDDGFEHEVCGGDDCDDDHPGVHPDAEETCNGLDDDCNEVVDDAGDDDGDDYSVCVDCDDEDPTIHPDALEACNDLDDDCDGAVDEGVDDDLDNDGFSECDGDCDDFASGVHPFADEYCNEVDDDCDTSIDEDAVDSIDWYHDSDADNWGVEGTTVEQCTQPAGWAEVFGDCDDKVATVYPGAPEICDGLDNNCDGISPADELVDVDGDGSPACADCDDSDDTVAPGLPEACDGVDNDCSGAPDKDEVDGDADSWLGCEECDDGDSSVHPNAPETCDGLDNDCDGSIDEGGGCPEANCVNGLDDDADGLVDCEDGDCASHPSCVEVCDDGKDNDGDGLVDCADDECWGLECHPDGVMVRVTSGNLVSRSDHREWVYDGCYGSYGSWDSEQTNVRGLMSSITGEVRVIPYGARWSTATTTATCEWTVRRGTFEWDGYNWGSSSYENARPVWRRNLDVESGCRLDEVDFLPDQLEGTLDGRARVYDDGPLWYDGAATLTSSAVTSSVNHYPCYSGSGSFTWGSINARRTWDLSMETGSSFHAEP